MSISLSSATITTPNEKPIELRYWQRRGNTNRSVANMSRPSKGGPVQEDENVMGQLEQRGVCTVPNAFAQLLQGCLNTQALPKGKRIHALIIKTGFETDNYIGNSIIDMYAKCGTLDDVRQVFDKMSERDVFSWTAIIARYARNGYAEEALNYFHQMHSLNIKPNQFTFGSVIRACANLENRRQGKQIHACIVKFGFESDVCLTSALVDMYCKSGNAVDGRNVFDKMAQRNVISWTAMIVGYANNGQTQDALKIFCLMRRAGMTPDQFAFTAVFKACTCLADLEHGKQVHAYIIKAGFETDASVRSAIVNMYAKCGSLPDACKYFSETSRQDVVICTAMIGGYAQNGQGEEALRLFCQVHRQRTKANYITLTTVIGICASLAAGEFGKQNHAFVIKSGFESIVNVAGALVDMYAKCGSVVDARNVFDKMIKQNTISCSAMIAGYAVNGHCEESLELFCKLQRAGMEPNLFTFASVLGACSSLADLKQGNRIHPQIIKTGFELDACVASALVDMYAKCGSVGDAHKVFEKMPERDIVSWTAMIAAYAQHGLGKEALQVFEQMKIAGIKPNHITFVSVLSACSHAGLVNEGHSYFDSMERDHGLSPTLQHYACMVDLLGRAGQLDEAEELINRMPFEPSGLVWRTLLSACRIHGNMDLGARAAEYILQLEPQNTATYVLLSNIYAAACRWDYVLKVRNIMKDRRVKKEAGLSWIEVNNSVHGFVVGDKSHPQISEIYAKLEELTGQMKEAAYVPQTNVLLHDVGRGRDTLSAITPHRTPLQIV